MCVPGPGQNVWATCASRPCFPGVVCINRRPPHVGYVCGRCPPGLFGNGRICTQNAKAGVWFSMIRQKDLFLLFTDVTTCVFLSVQSASTAAGWQKEAGWAEQQAVHDPPAQHSHQIQTPGRQSKPSPRPGSRFRARRRNWEARGGGEGCCWDLSWFQLQVPIRCQIWDECLQSKSTFSVLCLTLCLVRVKIRSSTILQPSVGSVPRPASSSGSPTGLLTVTQSKQAVQSQTGYLKPTQARPWTPPRPALPLTAALTALSFSLSESDLSADGDEAGPGPEVPETPHLDPAVLGRTVHSQPPQPTIVRPRGGSGSAAGSPEVTCTERPCFPGVPCEPSELGGFRCGRCPAGYTGDGRACRGGTPGVL